MLSSRLALILSSIINEIQRTGNSFIFLQFHSLCGTISQTARLARPPQ